MTTRPCPQAVRAVRQEGRRRPLPDSHVPVGCHQCPRTPSCFMPGLPKGEPLLAMTVPGADLPITGDYDLFAVCPSVGRLRRNWTARWTRRSTARGGRAYREAERPPELFNPRHGDARLHVAGPGQGQRSRRRTPIPGDLTPRIMAAITALVGAMGGRVPPRASRRGAPAGRHLPPAPTTASP